MTTLLEILKRELLGKRLMVNSHYGTLVDIVHEVDEPRYEDECGEEFIILYLKRRNTHKVAIGLTEKFTIEEYTSGRD